MMTTYPTLMKNKDGDILASGITFIMALIVYKTMYLD